MRVILGSILLALFGVSAPLFAVEPGDPSPDFTLPRLERNPGLITLSDYHGKVVYLDFWDSWCATCRESLPELAKLRNEFPRDDFEIIAVNLDTDPRDGMRFIARHPVGYPVASDPSPRSAEIFGLTSLPTAILIDRDGIVRHVIRGFDKDHVADLRRQLTQLIGARQNNISLGV